MHVISNYFKKYFKLINSLKNWFEISLLGGANKVI